MAGSDFRDGPRTGPDAEGRRTVLALPLADRLFLFLGVPGLVLLLGLGLPPLARWALSWQTGLPLRLVFRFVGGVDKPWEVAVNLAIWLGLALLMAFAAMHESMRVTLTDAELRVRKEDQIRTFARGEVSAVFLDGRELVVLDRRSRQLIRDTHEASKSTIAEAFRRHGYPWLDADPYAELFRAWSVGTADLPAAVNDVLTARETALKNKAHQQARELRSAVEKMGYVVRDDGVRQYWRPLVQR